MSRQSIRVGSAACRLDELAGGTCFQFSLELRTGAVWKAFLFEREGRVYGYLNVCRHAALSLSRTVSERGLQISTLYNIAYAERNQGKLVQARTQIETSLKLIESLRTKVSSHELRASYLASTHQHYALYTDLLMQLNKQHLSEGFDAAALHVNERAHARSLLDMLAETRSDIRQGVDPSLLESEQALRQQLEAKEQTRVRLLDARHTPEQAAAVETELSDLLTEYETVRTQLRIKSPRYAALIQPEPLELDKIRREVLDSDTLLLEYALGDERSFLWAVTPTSLDSLELPNRAEIETAARKVYELMMSSNTAAAKAQTGIAAANLSQMLLGPVADKLGKKRLLIVSDGALQYLPFAALPAPKSPRSNIRSGTPVPGPKSTKANFGPPLIVDHEIIHLPSASVLAVLRRELAGREPAPKAVAVLADPVFEKNDERVKALTQSRNNAEPGKLPDGATRGHGDTGKDRIATSLPSEVERSAKQTGLAGFPRLRFTRQEAEAITAMVAEGTKLKAVDFSASRATATNAELGQYRIVHFATHCLLNSQHPELSGIVLSLVDEKGQPQNGFLRAHEIYNLKLAADLVVLSGCQTALGKEIKGEGLMGLTRGFMYAGAARVMVSLWNVSDQATAELMKRFYKAMLVDALRPAAALRAAQVSMWNERRWEAPYYWAAFILQGEWR